MQHYILKPGGCGLDACGQLGISDERAYAVLLAAHADELSPVRRIIGGKSHYAVFLEQSAKRLVFGDVSLL